MGGVGDAKLAALSQRGHAGAIGSHRQDFRVRHGTQQIAHEVVEFDIGNEVRGLLVAQRSAEHARKSEQGMAAASQAIGLAVGADQLTLDTKCGGLQRDKIDVLESACHKQSCQT